MKIWWRLWIFRYLTFALVVWLFPHRASAQPKQEMISVSSPDIIARAKKEGKLLLHPALRPEYDEATIPELLKAFNKKYPFIEAAWGMSAMGARPNAKQALDELAAGKAVVDVRGFSGSFPSEYPERNLLKRFDLKTMARENQIKIPLEMIDETAMIVWSSNNTGIITYNSVLVTQDSAPRGWDSCVDPQWKGKFSVDTNPNTLTWLVPRWGEAKLLDFAGKLKENNPVFARGNTRNLGLLAEGKLAMNCSMYIHPMSRMLKNKPGLPIKMVIPDPLPITLHDPQAIYSGAKNPHAALLWLEFVASRDAQAIIDTNEPGRGSYLVEGNLVYKLAKSTTMSICNVACLHAGNELAEKIAREVWGLKESAGALTNAIDAPRRALDPRSRAGKRLNEISKSGRVVVYGEAASNDIPDAVFQLFEDERYRNITVLLEGFEGWEKRKFPVETKRK